MDITFQIVGKVDPVAVYAAIVATFVAGWNMFIWFRTGARVQLKISTGMVVMPPLQGMDEDDLYISFSVANIGTAPTTITNLVLFGYSNWFGYLINRPSKTAVINSGPPFSKPLPNVLKVGETYGALVNQIKDVEEWSRTHMLFGGVCHSTSERIVFCRIPSISKKPKV